MELQFYAFTLLCITTVMLTIENGNGLDRLPKRINELSKQTDNNKYWLMIVTNSGERNKPISRTNFDVLEKKKYIQDTRARKAHEIRMKEIIDFMETHMYSTVYLLSEVQRIKRDHQVIDELREMVIYLENPDNYEDKQLVLDFYQQNKKNGKNKNMEGVWNQKPNGAVINIIKDPFNDGVIN